MKRFTLSLVMTGVLGLGAYTMSGAQVPGRGPGWGPGRGGGPGFGRGEISLRGVELTDQQQAAIEAIHDEGREAREGRPAGLELHRALRAELFAEAPDGGKVAALQQQLGEVQTARLAREIAASQKVAQILTAEQRATVRERLAQAPPERGRRGGEGRPRPRP